MLVSRRMLVSMRKISSMLDLKLSIKIMKFSKKTLSLSMTLSEKVILKKKNCFRRRTILSVKRNLNLLLKLPESALFWRKRGLGMIRSLFQSIVKSRNRKRRIYLSYTKTTIKQVQIPNKSWKLYRPGKFKSFPAYFE